jgi:hypothetical protein
MMFAEGVATSESAIVKSNVEWAGRETRVQMFGARRATKAF